MKIAGNENLANGLIKSICLLLCVSAAAASSQTAQIAVFIGALLFAIFARKTTQAQRPKQIGLALGFALMFFESFAGYSLLSFAAYLFLFYPTKITLKKIPFNGFLWLIALWIAIRFLTDYSVEHIAQAIARGAAQDLLTSGISGATSSKFKIFYFGNYLLLSLFLLAFSEQLEMRKAFLRGARYALPIAVILSLWQIVEPKNFLMSNTNSFWIGTNRASGSFSDPNSFGISVALLLPLMLSAKESELKRSLNLIALLTLTLLALFSGSRTFILLLTSYLILFILKTVRQLWRAERTNLSSPRNWHWRWIANGLIMTSLLFLYFHDNPSIARVFSAFNLKQLAENTFSRAVFWRADLNLFSQNPIMGVGFNDFRLYLPNALEQLGININGWSDNPNSFYLGILSELGILGAILLVYGFQRLQLKKTKERSFGASLSLLGLVLALFFGPHFEFTEVALLSAFILAENFNLKLASDNSYQQIINLIIPPLTAILITKAILTNDGGYFPSGRSFWLKGRARLTINCNNLNRADLLLANDRSLSPISFQIAPNNNQPPISDKLNPKEQKKFSFDCENQKKIFIKYRAEQLARGSKSKRKRDQRWLSLRLSKL